MRRIGYRRTADVTGACISREHMRRSLHQTARGTPPRTAYVARSPVPSMRVTSGPGVPTGGSLSHSQRLRAPSSADERFDILQGSRDRMRFQESVSRMCRPTFQSRFGPLAIFLPQRHRGAEKEIRGCRGDVGDEMERAGLVCDDDAMGGPTFRSADHLRCARLAHVTHYFAGPAFSCPFAMICCAVSPWRSLSITCSS